GNQTSKDPMDRIAGGGTFARDPDAILTFTKHREADCFTVNVIQRSFKPIPPFVVRWQYPVLVRDNSLDPGDLEAPKKSGPSKNNSQIEMIMAALRGAESSGGLKYTKLREATGIPDTSFRRHLKKLITNGEIILSQLTACYQLSPKNAHKWSASA
ncbi:MAG TPA: hypothetical protein VE242_08290, partial [Chthoniobacterales bacterium]|nr:hypothetical protein [Chthoniobacterales bacterium]